MDPGVATRGLGPLGAGEPAAAAGGQLQMHSAPGRGLMLVLRLPLPEVTPVVKAPLPLSSKEATFKEAA